MQRNITRLPPHASELRLPEARDGVVRYRYVGAHDAETLYVYRHQSKDHLPIPKRDLMPLEWEIGALIEQVAKERRCSNADVMAELRSWLSSQKES